MTLDLTRIMKSIQRSGYAHVDRNISREELNQFCVLSGLYVVEDKSTFTWTVKMPGVKEQATVEGLRAQMERRR